MFKSELRSALESARNDLKKQPMHGDLCVRYAIEVLELPKVQDAFIRHDSNPLCIVDKLDDRRRVYSRHAQV